MPRPFSVPTDSPTHHPWNEFGLAFIVLLVIAAIAAAGGLLGHLIEPPKAIFLILLAMVVWSIGGWFLGGWRPVLAGLAALTAALAASNSDYVLSAGLSALLFVFLSTQLHIVSPRR